jgi:hypothetical protein
MSKPTIDTIQNRIDSIIDEVKELKDNKADKTIIALELELIKKDITVVTREQARVNSYGKWVILLIAGALLTAILKLIIK